MWTLSKRHLALFQLLGLLVFVVAVVINQLSRFTTDGTSEWTWAGGVTSTSARFRARAPSGAERTFVVSTSENLLDAGAQVLSQAVSFPEDEKVPVAAVEATGLTPNTKYYYGLVDDGSVTRQGSFSTPVVEGTRMNFKVAAAGCALSGSKSTVFKSIKSHEPLLMLHAGDMHYADIEDAGTLDERVDFFGRVLAAENARELYTSLTMAYMWDDHDFCGNNRNADCPGSDEARKSYQKAFPHYDLAGIAAQGVPADSEGLYDVAPFQAFTIGRVRFVLTDLRSEAVESTNDSPGSIMSPEQQTFLFNEFSNSSAYDFVIWVSSKPWVGTEDIGGDSWKGWPTDRQTVSNFIADTIGANAQNLMVVSSDAHMVAFDDGSNTDYSVGRNTTAAFPLLQSGPLHNIGSLKGGPFSEECHTFQGQMNHQFSILEFDEDATSGEPCVSFTSYRHPNTGQGTDSVILTKRMCGAIMKPAAEADAARGSGSCEAAFFETGPIVLWAMWLPIGILFVFVASKVLPTRKDVLKHFGVMAGFSLLVTITGIAVPLSLYLTTNAFHLEPMAIAAYGLFMWAIAFAYLFVVNKQASDASIGVEDKVVAHDL